MFRVIIRLHVRFHASEKIYILAKRISRNKFHFPTLLLISQISERFARRNWKINFQSRDLLKYF